MTNQEKISDALYYAAEISRIVNPEKAKQEFGFLHDGAVSDYLRIAAKCVREAKEIPKEWEGVAERIGKALKQYYGEE